MENTHRNGGDRVDSTALLRGIIRQLLEDGVITAEQYGNMMRCIEKTSDTGRGVQTG